MCGGFCHHCLNANRRSNIKYFVLILILGVIISVIGVLDACRVIRLTYSPDVLLIILAGLIVMTVGIIGIILLDKSSKSSTYDHGILEGMFIDYMKKEKNLKSGLIFMSPQFVASLKPDDLEKEDIGGLSDQKSIPVKNNVTPDKKQETPVKTDPVPEIPKVSPEEIPQSVKSVWNELNAMGFTVSVEEVYRAVQEKRNEFAARRIAYFGSDFELALGTLVLNKLPEPYEGYANEIVKIFSKPLDKNTYQSQLRKIGEKINNNHKQVLVVKRAEVLCRKLAGSGNSNAGNFSISTMEYAWAGLGGWMP